MKIEYLWFALTRLPFDKLRPRAGRGELVTSRRIYFILPPTSNLSKTDLVTVQGIMSNIIDGAQRLRQSAIRNPKSAIQYPSIPRSLMLPADHGYINAG
ncbi:hypothetical protein D1AOALGA4SA_11253 [Olavius algarvensis Delta 1 endosymbiont]|nr:hypothetical protein D1AOALGA4SA_11253 [Olavius algarvensis Delta 1 endosymbiont]